MSKISDRTGKSDKVMSHRSLLSEREDKRSDRRRTPSLKAREALEQHSVEKFWSAQKTFAAQMHKFKPKLTGACSESTLALLQKGITSELEEVKKAYGVYRDNTAATPESAIRRAVDLVASEAESIELRIKQLSEAHQADDLLSNHSMQSRYSSASKRSSTSSKLMNAAANAAAQRAGLVAKLEESRREEELQLLECEETKRRAEVELNIQQKKRELEEERSRKLVRIEEAKVSYYQAALDQEEDGCQSSASSASRWTKPVNKPDRLPRASPREGSNDFQGLAKALAECLTLSRLPVPEPFVFNGDPLKYGEWCSAFKTLIEEKNISNREKIHYLNRYVSGPAREAISGYLYLSSEDAFIEAKSLLAERYGNSFVVSEAFRDKLEAWPRIQTRDGLGLRKFADFLQQCMAAMKSMGGLEVLNDIRENRKLLQKLPDWIVSRWARVAADSKRTDGLYPPFRRFVDFVKEEADIACDPVTSLESLRGPERRHILAPSAVNRRDVRACLIETGDSSVFQCHFCKQNGHSLHDCRMFLDGSFTEKFEFIKRNGLCFGCLRQGHTSKMCRQRNVCNNCGKRHPTCLHNDEFQRTTAVSDAILGQNDSPHANMDGNMAVCRNVTHTEIKSMSSMIVPVWISTNDNPNSEHLVYALLDTQSDTSFILEETSHLIKTRSEPAALKLTTMTSKDQLIRCRKFKNLVIRGFDATERIQLPTVYSRKFIPADVSHIPSPEKARSLPHLQSIADKIPNIQECEIGLLIGYDCPQALAPKNSVTGHGNQPFAIETDLGWSIVGCIKAVEEPGDAIGLTHRIITKVIPEGLRTRECDISEVNYLCSTKLKEMIQPHEVIKMFELDFAEHHTDTTLTSEEDRKFLHIMTSNIHLNSLGNYQMPLPFKTAMPNLPNNKFMARKRMDSLKKRFLNNWSYYKDYSCFMSDIINHGDAEEIPVEEGSCAHSWYIPHHGVYHDKKPNKIRVVFDCSAKCQGTSLNNHLLTGPDLINTLVGILCRFRQEPVAIMCDIERMYHQFHVEPKHRDYLRFLWWKDGNLKSEPLKYRMRVHLFGAASSPGCANFGLKHLANKGTKAFSSESVNFIQRNFYVDDGLRSTETITKGIQLVKDTQRLCATGNLRLHKFISNKSEVMMCIPRSECAKNVQDLNLLSDELPTERALGIQWNVEKDTFQFQLSLKDKPASRRGILSTVASVYDPLGFIAPFTLTGKQLLQQLCKDGAGWDDPLPENLKLRWDQWINELTELSNLQIQRCFKPDHMGPIVVKELHHFSDASTQGYGQCSYLRLIDDEGNVHCSLVIAKGRVTPLKVITIPRLELTAAVISVKMSQFLRHELEYKDIKEFFWSDSKVVLGYINNDARRFQVFVANRVQQIREATSPDQWRYVPSEENPADHASRGLKAHELMSSNWLTGPSFLWNAVIPDEKCASELPPNDPEIKAKVLTTSSKPVLLVDRLERFSAWTRVVSTVTVLKRCARRFSKNFNQLDPIQEKQAAEMLVIKLIQESHFSEEISLLKKNSALSFRTVKRASGLFRLDPFIDNEGILRVGGRLQQSSLLYGVKHPVILPNKGHLTSLIARHHHERTSHQGKGLTMNELRSAGLWIIGCSHVVSRMILNCITCRKLRGPCIEQKMSTLPQERVEEAPPFTYSGMDCFGPFYIKEGRKELKRYGLLFTCMASRAIHVEVVDDMTSDAFINALRCFIALRGAVRQLRSDRGSNFVGAQHELKDAYDQMAWDKVKAYLMKESCDFLMNVPYASHMGGIWERQIRSVRNVLSCLLRHSGGRLDQSSLRTFFYEAMAIVNSRPLVYQNLNDPLSPEPLTPNHLLTMKSNIICPPPGNFMEADLYGKKRWRRVQYLANEFWKRWRNEYMLSLQPRQKWHTKRPNLSVNDIVIIKDSEVPRGQWRLGKVIMVIPDADTLVRKVRLQIGNRLLDDHGKAHGNPTIIERPVQGLVKIC